MNRHVAPTGRSGTYRRVLDALPNTVAERTEGALRRRPRPAFRPSGASSTLRVSIGRPRTLDSLALRDGAWTLAAALRDDEEAHATPLDAGAVPLSALWRE